MNTPSKHMLRTGWGMSIALMLMMSFSTILKLVQPEIVLKQFAGFEFGQDLIVPLAIAELACLVLYAIPRTSVLGAILVTGYMGGAVATHVRVHDLFINPLIHGLLAWGGLYFRDERIRALLPFRR